MATHPESQSHTEPLLRVVGEVAEEMHPGRQIPELTLDSDLETDAGLDSLGRVELMLRLQQAFSVQLADEAAVSARTPADLLAAIVAADPVNGQGEQATPAGVAASARGEVPDDAETLIDLLDHYAALDPGRVHVDLSELDGGERSITFGELHAAAGEVAAGLRTRGLRAGDPVAIMLPSGADFFFAFHGVLRAGGIPLPLYPPTRMEQLEDHCRRIAAILRNARTGQFIASERTRPAGRILQGLVPQLEAVVTTGELRKRAGPGEAVPRQADDLALLQYTSGTTGDPKGVMLTHANLLTNIRTMGTAIDADSTDVFVSWLPLYHDMGLIGAALGTLYYGARLVLLSPLQFMARPQRWLQAIHRHRGTLSAGPNFAYALCAARIGDAALEGLDLSSWRLAFNGAEPVSARAARRFCERFAPFGFDPGAMTPVYGLAESSLGLAFPPLGRGLRVDCVKRDSLAPDRPAEPAADEDPDATCLVGCGHVLAGHELRIVDRNGAPLPERHQGEIEFRGPSCTGGYYHNDVATRALYNDGWLRSGDLAYVDGGELYLTGRAKDLIIRAGRNIHPQDVEQAVGDVEGVRTNNVAVFASRVRSDEAEGLVVVAETGERDAERRAQLHASISEATRRAVDVRPDDVALVAPRTIPKTSSGKIRRSACRDLYESGRLHERRSASRQLLRLGAAGVGVHARRAAATAGRYAYALRAWITLGVIVPPAALLLLLLPGRTARAALQRGTARMVLALAGLRVSSADPPAETAGARVADARVADASGSRTTGGKVIVANHASYLDAIVLRAVLRGPLCFVTKRELARRPVMGLLLRRADVEFIDRANHRQGLRDLARVRERAQAGETVIVFPEGYLSEGPGLRGFRIGAFMVAVQAGLPVLPIAIRGTREVLRGLRLVPQAGGVSIITGRPISPDGSDWNAAVRLRERARAFIREHCGEPDLETTAHPRVAGNL